MIIINRCFPWNFKKIKVFYFQRDMTCFSSKENQQNKFFFAKQFQTELQFEFTHGKQKKTTYIQNIYIYIFPSPSSKFNFKEDNCTQ